jgi:hypothetical protein
MKRDRSDEELNDMVKPLEAFPLERLPTDILLKIILESGLSIAEIYRVSSINKRFRDMMNNTQFWDRVFIDRFLANNKYMQVKDREQYLDHPEFIKWREDRMTMPNDFVRILARIYDDENKNNMLDLGISRGIEKMQVTIPENSRWGHRNPFDISNVPRKPINRNQFETFKGYLGYDGTKTLYILNGILFGRRIEMDLFRFLYAMFMDGWVVNKIPGKLLESCVTCGQVAHFRCSETNGTFCGEKCFNLYK